MELRAAVIMTMVQKHDRGLIRIPIAPRQVMVTLEAAASRESDPEPRMRFVIT